MLAFRKRSSSWNSLVQQADDLTQRRFPSRPVLVSFAAACSAEASRRSAAAFRADRIRSVPSAYRCSTTRTSARFASPSRYCRSPRARPIWLFIRSDAARCRCSLAARLPNSPGSRRRTAPASSSVWPTSSAVMKKNRRLSASRPSGSGKARSRPSNSAAESRSTSSSAFRSTASRASTRASPCSMASLCCSRQVSAAVRVSAVSRSRPRLSISAGGATLSSPSNSVSSCPLISRLSRGASSSAASLRAESSRADSASTTAMASRLCTATSASRALNRSTRSAASPARISAARRVSATSSSSEPATAAGLRDGRRAQVTSRRDDR